MAAAVGRGRSRGIKSSTRPPGVSSPTIPTTNPITTQISSPLVANSTQPSHPLPSNTLTSNTIPLNTLPSNTLPSNTQPSNPQINTASPQFAANSQVTTPQVTATAPNPFLPAPLQVSASIQEPSSLQVSAPPQLLAPAQVVASPQVTAPATQHGSDNGAATAPDPFLAAATTQENKHEAAVSICLEVLRNPSKRTNVQCYDECKRVILEKLTESDIKPWVDVCFQRVYGDLNLTQEFVQLVASIQQDDSFALQKEVGTNEVLDIYSFCCYD